MNLAVKIILWIVVIGGGTVILGTMIGSRKGIRSFLLTAFQGIAAIFAVNVLGMISGVTIAVNWYTLGTGVVAGTPGVIAMLLLDAMLKT